MRVYPTHEVLGYLFGVSDLDGLAVDWTGAARLGKGGTGHHVDAGPGKKRRRSLDDLLRETPELAVVIDSFEQRVQRPRDRDEADGLYSGKKKQHTLKSQVAVDEESGQVVDIAESVPGRTADIRLLEESQLMTCLPEGVGGIGDSAYQGLARLHPHGLGASPRKKPWGSRAHRRTPPSTPPFLAAA